MFTFNKITGSFNVDFGTVNVKKSKLKMKQLILDEQDPIFLIPLPQHRLSANQSCTVYPYLL